MSAEPVDKAFEGRGAGHKTRGGVRQSRPDHFKAQTAHLRRTTDF